LHYHHHQSHHHQEIAPLSHASSPLVPTLVELPRLLVVELYWHHNLHHPSSRQLAFLMFVLVDLLNFREDGGEGEEEEEEEERVEVRKKGKRVKLSQLSSSSSLIYLSIYLSITPST
jgi:hypothetical protein